MESMFGWLKSHPKTRWLLSKVNWPKSMKVRERENPFYQQMKTSSTLCGVHHSFNWEFRPPVKILTAGAAPLYIHNLSHCHNPILAHLTPNHWKRSILEWDFYYKAKKEDSISFIHTAWVDNGKRAKKKTWERNLPWDHDIWKECVCVSLTSHISLPLFKNQNWFGMREK